MTERQIEKAVNEAAVLFEDQVRKGQVLDGKLKFADFVDRWFVDHAEKQLAPKTIQRCRQFMARIQPAIGHIRIDKLQPQHLMELYSNLSEDGIRNGKSWKAKPTLIGKLKNPELKKTVLAKDAKIGSATIDSILAGRPVTYPTAEKLCVALKLPMKRAFEEQEDIRKLASRTVLHYHRLISSILNTAVFWQIILSNPAKRVRPPKVKRLEVNFLDEHEATRVVELLEKEPIKHRTMIKLFLYSGLRRGELAGLEWGDIDCDKCMITIQRSSQYISGQGIITKETKTTTSDRSIRLPNMVFDMLKKYREWQDEERNRLGDHWFESDRLFTTYDGHPIHPDSITSWFTKFVKRQGLPKVTVHSLRHTNITLMIVAGVPLRTVARRAGHASTATTSVIYSHAIQTADELASEVLDDLLKPQVGGKRQVG